MHMGQFQVNVGMRNPDTVDDVVVYLCSDGNYRYSGGGIFAAKISDVIRDDWAPVASRCDEAWKKFANEPFGESGWSKVAEHWFRVGYAAAMDEKR